MASNSSSFEVPLARAPRRARRPALLPAPLPSNDVLRPTSHRAVRLLLLFVLFAGFGALLASGPLASSGEASVAASASRQADGAAPSVVRLFLVRHAEKSKENPGDPVLTEAGVERAAALGRMLAAADVTHLFSTELKRTRATVAPIAKARSLEVASYDGGDLDELAGRLAALPDGSVAVVAGHSNTTPNLFAALGAGTARDLTEHPRYGPMIPDSEYDRLYEVVLVRDGEGTRLVTSGLELRFAD